MRVNGGDFIEKISNGSAHSPPQFQRRLRECIGHSKGRRGSRPPYARGGAAEDSGLSFGLGLTIPSESSAPLEIHPSIFTCPTTRFLVSLQQRLHVDGITCMENRGRAVITGISLPRAGLVGKLDGLNFSALPSLTRLHLRRNYLFGIIPPSIRMLPALTSLDLPHNHLSGNLPLALASLSNLTKIDLSSNKFIGKIPPCFFANWTKLTSLKFQQNLLGGTLPPKIGQLKSLRALYLYINDLAGPIPSTLTNLRFLFLYRNWFFGNIPPELGSLVNLLDLEISHNNLTGSIPFSLGNLIKLKTLYLFINDLSGTIPYELGNLVSLRDLKISENQLSGSIPSTFGNLTMLDTLFLHTDHLSGSLPQDQPHLSRGAIPSSFESMLSLSSIDVSYNNLEGPVSRSKLFQNALAEWFIHNKGLCGEVPSLPSCGSTTISTHHSTKNYIILFVITPILGSLALLGLSTIIIAALHRKENPAEKKDTNVVIGDLFSILNFDGRVAYDYIINASENFDEKYCIGSGTYGKVYKVKLPMEQVAAVKKLHPMEEGVFDEKSFQNEIQALTRIRHRNIVKLNGFCTSLGCKFLIYEYIERGSLASILCNQETTEELNWERRAHIIKDETYALSYMHHDCNPSIMHRDISNNNILLDSDFKAYLLDFGTVRILKSNLSNWSTLAGTFGYAAPELSYMTRANEKCDVYSFGIVILEVIMGRHPSDLVFFISSSDVQQMLFSDVLDQQISPPAAYMAYGARS
ncbi:probable leucine-rich repeat receptor-like protein kinase At1g35710 [Phoenix dactylifera]|uniref:non-specific serine/threonine protein kinase n=1 Tax=Phoenix dactylifera TaxID=42345 RepID=A0A8B8ZEH8_PHODC|nr:probable leucine-rich repeat receptor-like protein kinase At1g35710 [Phoenix dactylifera]